MKTNMGLAVPELRDDGFETFFPPLIQAFGNDKVVSS